MSLQETYICDNGKSKTFENDEKLPNLPVPSLSHTLERYLDSVKPFASQNEYYKTERIVKAFQNGIGKELHSKLLKKAAKERNWLEKWWEDYAYLTLREPLIPYYSMVGPHPPTGYGWQYIPSTGKQIKYAALQCYHVIHLWLLLRQERFKPQTSNDKKPLSMSQFRRIFNCTRVPGITKDIITAYFKTEREGPCSSNVIVLCNGHIFVFNSLHEDGSPLTQTEWLLQLFYIKDIATSSRGLGIASLTCDYRTPWAKNREHLINLSSSNAENLSIIEAALFVLCLDDSCPRTESDVSEEMINGDYTCRWADKSVNLVFFENGMSGGVCDHSAFDGIASIMVTHYIHLALKESKGQWQGSREVRPDIVQPKEIQFFTDTHIRQELKRVQKLHETERYKFKVIRECFTYYGKEEIQKFKVHPDAYVQMALQFAYYKLHNRPAPCYETATVRTYYNGRTETVRSCTAEAVNWVKSMLNPLCEDVEKARLLNEAISKHVRLMNEAKNNQGCDRHLFGMYCIAMEEGIPVPELYSDPLYSKSGGGGNFVLSTSLSGYLPMGGGVSPMCLDGYGVFYSITPDLIWITLSANISSWETSTSKFFMSLSDCLLQMKELLSKTSDNKIQQKAKL